MDGARETPASAAAKLLSSIPGGLASSIKPPPKRAASFNLKSADDHNTIFGKELSLASASTELIAPPSSVSQFMGAALLQTCTRL
jgi:hypothetical protein